jgi:hypothetical protein
MLKHWLTDIQNKDKKLIFVGVAAIMCAIWCTHNYLIFSEQAISLFYAGYFQGSILVAVLVPAIT